MKVHDPSQKSLSILPVTGVTISTAVNGRSKKVTRQVFLPLFISNHHAPGIFLVVPHLTKPIILGDDWLCRHGVIINYITKNIEFPQWDMIKPFRPDVEESTSSQITNLCVHRENGQVIATAVDHCLSNIDSVQKFIKFHSQSKFPISTLENQPENLENSDDFQKYPGLLPEISENEPICLVRLLEEFQDIFSDKPGLCSLYTCKFTVTEDVPFKIKPYPIPFSRRPAVEKELGRMLEWGVIERCSSPYSNPVVCVGKADGSVRLCLDARRINRLIQPMRDSSAPLDELLARFGGKSLFSSIDFTSGYWQVPLHQDVRKFTAFVFEGRTYQFCVVPFGLNISNTAFGFALEALLSLQTNGEEDGLEDLHIYVDEVLVSSTSLEDHILRLRLLFNKIRISGMTLKLSKCEFLRQRIKFLGHIITPEGMSMDPEKLQAIHEFPQPRNKKELQSFIGFCNFYRKFSERHALNISPLIELLKKGTQWKFGFEELKHFNRVRESFTEQYLSHPQFDRCFYLQTDASKLGLGAELFQLSPDGERQTILFASRTLNSAERNYSVTELELLSIVFACEKFRVFILGYPVIVLTDHQALTFLFHCRLRNARLTRWTLLLQEFNLKVDYIPGSENIVDALSRNPVGRDDKSNETSLLQCILSATSKFVQNEYARQIKSFSSILETQQHDQDLKKIMDQLLASSKEKLSYLDHYSLVGGVLFFRRYVESDQWLVCIPSHRVNELISNIHEHFGHVGPKKCILAIRDFCFFPRFQKQIRLVVQSCTLCQKTKTSTQRTHGEMHSIMSETPMGKILVDLYGPLPPGWNQVRYIFVVLDNFTRYVRLYPIKKATAVTVTNRMINDYIATYGVPHSIVSDHGVQFQSTVWQNRLSAMGIPPTMTSVYHPQSNPAERVMRELGRMFRTYVHHQHVEWPRYVQYIEWVLNNTVHEATGSTPHELFLAGERYNPFSQIVEFPLRVPITQRTKLTMAAEVQMSKSEERRKRHNRQGPPISYTLGTLVLVRTHHQSSAVDKCIQKFFLLYEGPYEIVECKAHNAYVVVDPETRCVRGTFNVIHIRRYRPPVSLQQAEVVAISQKP